MNVCLVGAGLQGRRRAGALSHFADDRLVVVADINLTAAQEIAAQFDCPAIERWEEAVANPDVETVLVCTPPHLHAEIAGAAVERRKHVLCEKPLAHNMEAGRSLLAAAREGGVTVKCGFNYHLHPGIRRAHQWVEEGLIGELMFIRCRHGIGGRPGYEDEWRVQAQVSGGGQLMDQGLHVLDLLRWFLGDFDSASGVVSTSFWPIEPLEDNVFALLRSAKGQVGWFHASWTHWKNLFSFEIFGRDGYITVEGLGGSYGTERAILGKRAFLEPFREEIIEFRGEDSSWVEEWQEFVSAIRAGREPLGSGKDGLEAQRLAEAIYESARTGTVVRVAEIVASDSAA